MKLFSLSRISIAIAGIIALSMWIDTVENSRAISNAFEVSKPKITNAHGLWLVRKKITDRTKIEFKK